MFLDTISTPYNDTFHSKLWGTRSQVTLSLCQAVPVEGGRRRTGPTTAKLRPSAHTFNRLAAERYAARDKLPIRRVRLEVRRETFAIKQHRSILEMIMKTRFG